MKECRGTLKNELKIIFKLIFRIDLLNKLYTVLSIIVTANRRDLWICFTNLKRIGARSGRRLSGREWNEIQTLKNGGQILSHIKKLWFHSILPNLTNGFLQLFREFSVRSDSQRTSWRSVDGISGRLPVRVVDRDCTSTFIDRIY